MIHRNDVPGRDVENYHRWGIAPAITFGIGGADQPDARLRPPARRQYRRSTASPISSTSSTTGRCPEADDSAYFGYRNLDEQEQTVDRADRDLPPRVQRPASSIRNLTRWQRVDQHTQTSAPQGTFCLAGTGRQPVPATAERHDRPGLHGQPSPTSSIRRRLPAIGNPLVVNVPPGFWQPNGPRGRVRDQSNELLYNQTDLRVESGHAGGVHNILVVGALLHLGGLFDRDRRAAPQRRRRRPVLNPIESISNPSGIYTGPINYTVTARSRGDARTTRPSTPSTRSSSGRMFELNGGVRYERAKGTFRNIPLAHLSAGHGAAHRAAARAAAQRRARSSPTASARSSSRPRDTCIYAAFGNARTPTSATVRLGCGVIAAPGAADPCAAAPETARNYEIGVKADLFGRRLQVDRRPVPQRAQQFPRRRPTIRSLPTPAGGRRPLAGRRLRARPVGQHHAGLVDLRQLHLSRQRRCCRACPISASPHPSAACLQHAPAAFPIRRPATG